MMDNFANVAGGYKKEEVNEFVDYVIRKTEDNILTIKKQKEEIEALILENERLKKLEDSYIYIQSQIENIANEVKSNAKYEADLIIREAKENASSIINDALLRAEKLENDKENLNQSLKMYKRKVKNALMEQLEIIDDIEVLQKSGVLGKKIICNFFKWFICFACFYSILVSFYSLEFHKDLVFLTNKYDKEIVQQCDSDDGNSISTYKHCKDIFYFLKRENEMIRNYHSDVFVKSSLISFGLGTCSFIALNFMSKNDKTKNKKMK